MLTSVLASMRILGGILVVLWGSGVAAEIAPSEPAPGTRKLPVPAAISQSVALPSLRPGSPAEALPVAAEFGPPGSRAEFTATSFERPRVRPEARDPELPSAQWNDEPQGALWTRSMISALMGHGSEVLATVPEDIAEWCPAYAQNSRDDRAAFWVGLMSAIAHHESRHLPHVVGAGQYYGLLQIYPPTARAVDCRAASGDALKGGSANLSCAVRIMAEVVPEHDAVAIHSGGWRGIANQWGPMTRRSVREELRDWTREQDYCQLAPLASAPRPPARPFDLVRSEAPDDGLRVRG